MLTRKDYEKALNGLRELEKEDNLKKIRIKEAPQLKADTLNELIHEHFDNPPLEFEELKEGMFVWDNKHHTYIKIDRIWESYNKTIYFYAIGWECCENTEYESNRFYRKEVHE